MSYQPTFFKNVRAEPLGDQAIFLACATEATASACAERIRARQFPWQIDVVQAYRSVAIYLDGMAIDYPAAVVELAEAGCLASSANARSQIRRHTIPCCYERGIDFDRIQRATHLSQAEIVALHAAQVYTVYAIGFCPGFPYLGYLPDALANVPRLDSPRLKVEAGSVGLTGRQTGIYTEVRPGGWNIVGQTPLTLVDVADGYFPLRTGDEVQFDPISPTEFERLRGSRLVPTES